MLVTIFLKIRFQFNKFCNFRKKDIMTEDNKQEQSKYIDPLDPKADISLSESLDKIGKEMGLINKERKKLAKEMRSATNLEEVAELRSKIDELDAQGSELNNRRKAAFAENQRISNEYAPQVDELYLKLE